ncbi:MAG: GNAT family N-acetyltransferase [Muribaculaceae bacterium]|nr:GNAT family N-acetyltransferase [Muribaculaceae bacterium]
MEYKIIDALPENADLVAWGIMEAVGEEIIASLAGEKSREDVAELFARLVRREDSQYSYLNTRIAVDSKGNPMGICVSYSGKDLKSLRRAFFEEARRTLGWQLSEEEIDSFPAETCDEEFYLDSLAVVSGFRGHGVGSALISDTKSKASQAGLPLGLLVADDNPAARQLYESLGFRPVGRRPFAGEEMTNMRILSDASANH